MKNLASSDSWRPWHWKINEDNMEALQEKAVDRLHQAILELAAAEEVLAQIQYEWASHTLYVAGVSYGDRVVVEYKDGNQEAIFEGVETKLLNPIVIRHITKKGTPEKRPHWTHYTMAKHIRPKEAGRQT